MSAEYDVDDEIEEVIGDINDHPLSQSDVEPRTTLNFWEGIVSQLLMQIQAMKEERGDELDDG